MKRISGVAEEKQTVLTAQKEVNCPIIFPPVHCCSYAVQKFDINIKKDRRHFVNALRNEGFHPIFKTE